MHTIGDTIDRRTGLPADSLCEAALAIFIHELDCRALAVVDGDRPIGIVHREPFLARMERAGAVVSTVESALFELLERAGTPEFKQVQRLIL